MNNEPQPLTPEQIILWLEQMRALMHEVWKNNPDLRREYEELKALSEIMQALSSSRR